MAAAALTLAPAAAMAAPAPEVDRTVGFTVQSRAWVTAGIPFSVTVRAVDAAGAVDPSYRGTVNLMPESEGRSPVLPGPYTFTAADAGVHTFQGVQLHHAVVNTLIVRDAVDFFTSGRSTVRVGVGPVTGFGVWVGPRSQVNPGEQFNLRVAPVDDWGNYVHSYRGTVAFSSSAPGEHSLPATYSFSSPFIASASFSGLSLNGTPGLWNVTVTDVSRPELAGSDFVRIRATAP